MSHKCNIVTFLPEEMFMEILLALPSKSVIRFRSVCKPWRSLLSSSRFMAEHLLPEGNDDESLLIVKYRHKETRDHVMSLLSGDTLAVAEHGSNTLVPPPFPGATDDLWNLEILGSCCLNGVVCIHYQAYLPHVALWNVATGDFKYLPPADDPDPPGAEYPSISEFGFGYDADSQDYKVVRVTPVVHTDWCKVDIYTSSSGTWRGQHRDLPGDAIIIPLSGHSIRAYANGIFSWRAARPMGEWDAILWFRMSDESFGLTMFPPNRQEGYSSIFALNDRISLILYDMVPIIHRCFHVWVLLEIGVAESWTQLFTLGPFEGIEYPLRFWNNGKMIMEDSDGDLFLCDPFSQEIKSLGIQGSTTKYPQTQIASIPAKYNIYPR